MLSEIGSGNTGDIGYWNRTGTTLSPVNDGDNVEIDGDFTLTTDANTVDAGTNAYVWRLDGGDSNGHHLELSKKTKAGSESCILRVDRSSGDLNIDNNEIQNQG